MENESEIIQALISRKFYNPYDVFCHAPEFYTSDFDGYSHLIHIVKWNTRSTRMTVLYARFDNKKQSWVFKNSKGLKRNPHGEKMR